MDITISSNLNSALMDKGPANAIEEIMAGMG
jgi:hypothetical protein